MSSTTLPTTTTTTTTVKFDSEGFDLDAAVSNIDLSPTTSSGTNKDVIYEIGGTTTATTTATAAATNHTSMNNTKESTAASETNDKNSHILQMAESLKEQGNDYYKNHDYRLAYETYTAAIRTIEVDVVVDPTTTTKCVWTGRDILQKKDVWEQEQQLRLRNELRQRDSTNNNTDVNNTTASSTDATTEPTAASPSVPAPPPPPPQFVLEPPHPYGTVLAMYYCNRAAASMQIAASESIPPMKNTTTSSSSSSWYDHPDDDDVTTKNPMHPQDQEALQDCTIAILLNPKYTKAYIRRATIYEQRFRPHSNTEMALHDMLTAQELEPNNRTISTQVRRLQQVEQERMERMKEETMSKLKDLGNSILGNFGLSLDNFKTQQDPNTGSYNISFSQN